MNAPVARPYRLIVRRWADDQVVLDQAFAAPHELETAKAEYMTDYNDPARIAAGRPPAFDITTRIVKPRRRSPRRKVAVNLWGFGA